MTSPNKNGLSDQKSLHTQDCHTVTHVSHRGKLHWSPNIIHHSHLSSYSHYPQVESQLYRSPSSVSIMPQPLQLTPWGATLGVSVCLGPGGESLLWFCGWTHLLLVYSLCSMFWCCTVGVGSLWFHVIGPLLPTPTIAYMHAETQIQIYIYIYIHNSQVGWETVV